MWSWRAGSALLCLALVLAPRGGAAAGSVVNVTSAALCDDVLATVPFPTCVVRTPHTLNCSGGGGASPDWPFPRDAAPDQVCALSAPDAFDGAAAVVLNVSAPLTCANATLCQLLLSLGSGGALLVGAGGSVAANTIVVRAGRAEVAAGGEVSAAARGLRFGSAPGRNRGGGSFAGSGGFPPYTAAPTCPLNAVGDSDGGGGGGLPVATCCLQAAGLSRRFTTLAAQVGSFSSPDAPLDGPSGGGGGGGGALYGFGRDWDLALGSGGGEFNTSNSGGRSGGRIALFLVGTLVVNGSISADGEAASAARTVAGSGSGGTVLVAASSISGAGGRISAAGGAVPLPANVDGKGAGGGGGGGGRIVIRDGAPLAAGVTVDASGGTIDGDESTAASCLAGSAGTIFRSTLVDAMTGASYNQLTVSNTNGMEAFAATLLDVNFVNGSSAGAANATADELIGVDLVTISQSTEVVSRKLITRSAPFDLGRALALPPQYPVGLSVSFATLSFVVDPVPDPEGGFLPVDDFNASAAAHIAAADLRVSTKGFINAPPRGSLVIECARAFVQAAGGICFQGQLALVASASIALDVDINLGAIAPGDRSGGCVPEAGAREDVSLMLRAASVTFGADVTFDVPRLFVFSSGNVSVQKGGRITATRLQSDSCPGDGGTAFARRPRCSDLAWAAGEAFPAPSALSSNLTLVLSALDTLVVAGSIDLVSGALCGYSTLVPASGSVLAVGQGCESDEGPGRGAQGSAGGGAGHAGPGGKAAAGAAGGAAYDGGTRPLYPGSGGGSGSSGASGGSGGGYVLLEGRFRLLVDGEVRADGADGAGGGSGGGGSGGAVIVETFALLGTGLVSARGGSGSNGEGGGGGGGSGGIVDLRSSVLAPLPPGGGGQGGDGVHPGRLRRRELHAGGLLGDVASDFFGALSYGGGAGACLGAACADAGANGTLIAPACFPGLEIDPTRGTCLPCGLGFWRNGSYGGAQQCAPCTNLPAGGTFVDPQATSADCAFTCPVGTLFPLCETPFEQLVTFFGGEAGFTLSLGGVLGAIALVLLFLRRRRMLSTQALLLDGDGSGGGAAGGGGGIFGKVGPGLGYEGYGREEEFSAGLLGSGGGNAGGRGASRGYGAAPASARISRFGIRPARAGGACIFC